MKANRERKIRLANWISHHSIPHARKHFALFLLGCIFLGVVHNALVRPRVVIHKCNYETVPYVIGELPASQILRYSNKSLVRFGDVDMDLMQGISWPTQKASKALSSALLQAMVDEVPDLFVGIYDIFEVPARTSASHAKFLNGVQKYRKYLLRTINREREYMPTLISSPFVIGKDNSCIHVKEVYNNLREIWRDKDVVLLRGANKQVYEFDVYDTARSQQILYAPPTQAWNSYADIKEELFKQDKNSLFILSAGPLAKVLAYDLAKAGRRVLDLGHLAKDYNLYLGNQTIPNCFYQD